MSVIASPQNLDEPYGSPSAVLPGRTIVIVVAGIIGAWVAAGSAGFIDAPLQKAICWFALAAAITAGWPRDRGILPRWLVVIGAATAMGLIFTASANPAVNVLGIAVVLTALAGTEPGVPGRAILLSAVAVTILAVFRLAWGSVPIVWLLAGWLGRGLGGLAGWLTGRPLWIGASLGGIDFLVLMAALYGLWLAETPPPRRSPAIWAAAAILLTHGLYLVLLAFSHDMVAALPPVVRPSFTEISRLGVWTWGNAARSLLPWSLPMVAAALYALIAAAMFRWAPWLPSEKEAELLLAVEGAVPRTHTVSNDHVAPSSTGQKEQEAVAPLLRFGPAVLAAVIPLATVLAMNTPDLKGRAIVAYETGGIDWSIPAGDQPVPPAAKKYSLLPELVESCGGSFTRSAELSDEDLAEADVLLLLPPGRGETGKGLEDPQRRERIWEFVRRGGSLLVAAEPETHPGAVKNVFNEVLAPTAIRVRDDTAVSLTERWEFNCRPLPHAATSGLDAGRGEFGFGRGASLIAGWPASPLIVAPWSWSEPGSDAAAGATARYSPGDKLGDLVLAAEQRVGRGRVVVLGDAACLDDNMLVGAYPFAGRLLAYLAAKTGSPQALLRQLLGLAAMACLVALLLWRPDTIRLMVAVVVLAATISCCAAASNSSRDLLPEGRPDSAHPVAYIDASHTGPESSDPAREDGLGQLARTLMRNGYLPLETSDIGAKRLERAALLISMAPARQFSAAERKAVRGFVEGGGTFISMVGAQEAAASRPLLADFDLRIPLSPVPPSEIVRETVPLGRFRQLYGNPVQKTFAEFYAGWPVEGPADAEVLVAWSDGAKDYPVVISRKIGKGAVVLIGDTCFGMNKNMVAEGGEVHEDVRNMEAEGGALHENVRFSGWLLGRLRGREVTGGETGAVPLPARNDAARSKTKSIEPAESELIDEK